LKEINAQLEEPFKLVALFIRYREKLIYDSFMDFLALTVKDSLNRTDG